MRRVKRLSHFDLKDIADREAQKKRRIQNLKDDLDFCRRRLLQEDSNYPSKTHAEELEEYEAYINQEWHR